MALLHTDFDLLEEKSELLKTMGHPIRLSIIELLCTKDRQTVTELYTSLEIEQAVASHHLRIMKNSNILKSSRSGKNAYYSLADKNIKKIFKILVG